MRENSCGTIGKGRLKNRPFFMSFIEFGLPLFIYFPGENR